MRVTLHGDLRAVMIVSRWILLGMRNVTDNIFRENQNTNFMFNNFFPLWNNLEKYGRTRQATDDKMTRHMHCAYWTTKATDTQAL